MAIRKELIEELFKDCKSPDDLLGPDGLIKQLKAALVERALEAEMTDHLGYERDDPAGQGSGNSRNGCSSKTLRSDDGPVPLKVPRDREGTFEPKIVKKHQRHFDGFDDKIISMYARGMSVREIQGHLQEIYGTEVSPDLISRVTDGVLDEVKQWQQRPLDAIYPIIYLDALVLKVRDQGVVQNKSAYLAIGVNMDGIKEVLGIWLETTEGAKFWLKVITELKNRGIQDMLIVCCDGLKGFPAAIEAVFPKSVVQLCIVHMIRNSLRFVAWKDRKAVAADLKLIYRAETPEAAAIALDEFEEKYGARYPMIVQSWRSNWERVTPFLAFSREIRKVIYTTNAIESLNSMLRRTIKTRGHFPNDTAATKLLYLALIKAEKKWTHSIHGWNEMLNQLAVYFEGRLLV
ncbi:MAG: putative transposase [Hyphomicrobiaceae bacterium]|jgi:putative transposase